MHVFKKQKSKYFKVNCQKIQRTNKKEVFLINLTMSDAGRYCILVVLVQLQWQHLTVSDITNKKVHIICLEKKWHKTPLQTYTDPLESMCFLLHLVNWCCYEKNKVSFFKLMFLSSLYYISIVDLFEKCIKSFL